MKVLVIGSLGSMGRRYCAILKYLGIDYTGVDKGHFNHKGYSHAIISTPTETHFEMILAVIRDIPNILCEKPVSKNLEEIQSLQILQATEFPNHIINMVCNYKYAIKSDDVWNLDIEYSNYNTGKDGLGWDLIQLIYLAKNIKLSTETPFFKLKYKDPSCNCSKELNLSDIEKSYIDMIRHWLGIQGRINDLWNLSDAVAATENVIKWEKSHERES